MSTVNSMSGARLFGAYLADIKFEFVKSLRTPSFAIPTLLFPAMFYLLFGVFLGNARLHPQAALYTFAGYGVFGAMAPGLFGFGVSLAFEREQGLLTFKQAIPAPAGAYLLARMLMAMLFVAIIALILIFMAVIIAHVPMTFGQAVRVLVIDVLGVLPFCAIGLFVGTLVSGQAAPAVVNLIYLPMAFLSGLWVPMQFLPAFLKNFADVWPAHHLTQLALGAVGAPTMGKADNHVFVLGLVTLVFFWLAQRRLQSGGFRLLGTGKSRVKVLLAQTAVLAVMVLSLLLVARFFAPPVAAQSAPVAVDPSPIGVAAPAAPAVASFDTGSAKAVYGEGWHVVDDKKRGGDSTASVSVIDGGAVGSAHALEVTGKVGAILDYPFAGTMFFPSGPPMEGLMDYSAKKSLHFQIKGDGKTYVIMMFAGPPGGIPSMINVNTTADWHEVDVPLSEFNSDLKRVRAIGIGSMERGSQESFRFAIDEVEVR